MAAPCLLSQAPVSRFARLRDLCRPVKVKCAVCLEDKSKNSVATCNVCVDGVVCYECSSRCDVQLCANAGCNQVHMVCPVCMDDSMSFNATAPQVTKSMVLRIATNSLAGRDGQLEDCQGWINELVGTIREHVSENPEDAATFTPLGILEFDN